MPLPLGHTAAGLAIHDLYPRSNGNGGIWRTLGYIIVLTNLPDIDVLIGLIVHGNGNVFHRGPTHSFLFALVMGVFACNAWRYWSRIPKLNFVLCFLLILSHVLADGVLTTSPVSFWWPLELNWSVGHSGWTEVIESVFFGAFQDLGLIFASGAVVLVNRLIRHKPISITLSRLVKGRLP